MFATACEKASKFTRPVIVSTRTASGKVSSGLGAFIIVNRDGWFVTAGHLFDSFVRFQEESKRAKEAEAGKKIPGFDPKDPNRIVNHSFWWGWDNVSLETVYINREIDIAVGKLRHLDPSKISEYPVFKRSKEIRSGMSLCRLGFPFVQVSAEFDEKTNAFRLKKETSSLTLFPNDGIHTRTVVKGKSMDGNYDMLYVETSTPGLRGQSGGPIFDKNGHVCAVQVGTTHLPLGFHPEVEFNGMKVVENQFLNVGFGVHAETIRQVLKGKGVPFSEESGE